MGNKVPDEFDILEARDWARALISCHKERKALDSFNSQIRTAPLDRFIRMGAGIEMLADLLGAELEEGAGGRRFFFQGMEFFQPRPEGAAGGWMPVLCGCDECMYNRGGKCGKESISISRKTFSGFRSGEREWSPACDDYKELEDGAD